MTKINSSDNLSQLQTPALETLDGTQTVLFDLAEYGIIHIHGADATKFLQGQLTSNLEQMSSDQMQLSAQCNPQGRILSLFWIGRGETDSYYLVLPTELVKDTLNSLKKYAVFYQCSITDGSEQTAILGVSGNCAESSLLSENIISAADDVFRVSNDETRAFILIPKDALPSRLRDAQVVAPYAAWLALDILKGIPRLYQTSAGAFLPHNLQLPELGGVSFDKGCYTGQEVVARMHYKGKLKSHMRLLIGQGSSIPEPLSAIENEQEKKFGEVICATHYQDQQLILALCKDSIENEGKIRCKSEKTSILTLS